MAQVYNPAIMGTARLGAMRLGYFIPYITVQIAGVRRELLTRMESISITDNLGTAPSTCQFRVSGFVPLEHQEIIVGLGTTANRIFGGTIQQVQQVVEGDRETNIAYDCTCVDYSWLLNKRLVYGTYTGTCDAIITQLVQLFTDHSYFFFFGPHYIGEFTTSHVEVGGNTFTITFKGDTFTSALNQIAHLGGGAHTYVDYYKDIHFYRTDTVPGPVTVTSANIEGPPTIARDISQIRNVVNVFGASTTIIASVAAPSIAFPDVIIPVHDATAFTGGGFLTPYGDRCTYLGASGTDKQETVVLGVNLNPTPVNPIIAFGDTLGVVSLVRVGAVVTATFGNVVYQPISSITKAGSTVTITTANPHGGVSGLFIILAGMASVPEWQGTFGYIEVTSATTFDFEVPTALTNPIVGANSQFIFTIPFIAGDNIIVQGANPDAYNGPQVVTSANLVLMGPGFYANTLTYEINGTPTDNTGNPVTIIGQPSGKLLGTYQYRVAFDVDAPDGTNLGTTDASIASVPITIDGVTAPTAPTGTVLSGGLQTILAGGITTSGTGVATATTQGDHNFSTNDNVTITGTLQTPYNGNHIITVTGNRTFTFLAPIGTGAATTSGTITVNLNVSGNLAPGSYSYKVTFVTPQGETEASIASNLVTIGGINSPTPPTVAIRTGGKYIVPLNGMTRAANIVTVDLVSTLHGYSAGDVVTVAGATQVDYNNTWKILAPGLTGTAFTFDINEHGGTPTPAFPATTFPNITVEVNVSGNLVDGTYNYHVTFVTSLGDETISSVDVPITLEAIPAPTTITAIQEQGIALFSPTLTRTANVVTVVATNTYSLHASIVVTLAFPDSFNGTFTIDNVTGSGFTYIAAGPDGVASGTPTIRLQTAGNVDGGTHIYGVTFVTSGGGETVLGSTGISSTITVSAVAAPFQKITSFIVSPLNGNLEVGSYSYLITFTTPLGETTAGPPSDPVFINEVANPAFAGSPSIITSFGFPIAGNLTATPSGPGIGGGSGGYQYQVTFVNSAGLETIAATLPSVNQSTGRAYEIINLIDSPSAIGSGTAIAGGNLTPNTFYTYGLCFVDNVGNETALSGGPSIITGIVGGNRTIRLAGIPVNPPFGPDSRVVARRLYRSSTGGNGPFFLVTSFSSLGPVPDVRTTIDDAAADNTLTTTRSTFPSLNSAGTGQIRLENIPMSTDPFGRVKARNIYRTTNAGGTKYGFVAKLDGNSVNFYNDNTADSALGTKTPIIKQGLNASWVRGSNIITVTTVIENPYSTGDTVQLTNAFPSDVNGTYQIFVTIPGFSFQATSPGASGSGSVTSTILFTKISSGQITLNNVPKGTDKRVTGRKIYRTTKTGGGFQLVGTLSDNITETFLDNVADTALTSAPLAQSTAGGGIVDLSNIPRWPGDPPAAADPRVSGRRIYRTIAGNLTSFRLLTSTLSGDTTLTTFTDNIADKDLLLQPEVHTISTGGGSQVRITNIPTSNDARVTTRRIYRTTRNGFVARLLATISDNTTTFYIDNSADTSLGNDQVTIATAGGGQIRLTNILVALDNRVTARKIYRTRSGGFDYQLVGTIRDNIKTTFIDNLEDKDLSITDFAPSINEAGGSRIDLVNIPIGPPNTTGRRLYRTEGNGTIFKYLAVIQDNVTRNYQDTKADSSLGVDAKILSELKTGIGSNVLFVENAHIFPDSGWVIHGNQAIRFRSKTIGPPDYLGGIPTTGEGSIKATLKAGDELVVAPTLFGVAGLITPLIDGDEITLWSQVSDAASIATVVSLEGKRSSGIHESEVSDSNLNSYAAMAVRGQAELTLFSNVEVKVDYYCRDIAASGGRTVTLSLSSPTSVSGTFLIQKVTISQMGNLNNRAVSTIAGIRGKNLYPLRRVESGTTRFTLDDVMRLLNLRP